MQRLQICSDFWSKFDLITIYTEIMIVAQHILQTCAQIELQCDMLQYSTLLFRDGLKSSEIMD